MDCSVEYIEMCRKAVEVQAVWKPEKYDIVYDVKGRKNIHVVTSYPDKYYPTFSIDRFQEKRKKEEFIWLSRQDQLQNMVEMVKDKSHRQWRFFHWAFHENYLPITNHCPYIYFMNMVDRYDIEEILWLAFVMWELFSKRWLISDKEWVTA